MSEKTIGNYGTTAVLLFISFILLSFYTSQKCHEVLELRSDTCSMGRCHRTYVVKQDSVIKEVKDSMNHRFKFVKATVQ